MLKVLWISLIVGLCWGLSCAALNAFIIRPLGAPFIVSWLICVVGGMFIGFSIPGWVEEK